MSLGIYAINYDKMLLNKIGVIKKYQLDSSLLDKPNSAIYLELNKKDPHLVMMCRKPPRFNAGDIRH